MADIEVRVQSQHMLGGTKEKHEQLGQDSWYLGQDLKQRSLENAEVLTTQPLHSEYRQNKNHNFF
jgi:hypothetical protein